MIFQSDPRHANQVMVTQLLVAVLSLPVLVYFWHWWYAVYLLSFYSFLLFIGHHAGLHRYFSHRSFSTSRFWHAFLCLSSCLVCFGSPAMYSVAHRAHHVYTDTEQDPHGLHIGMFNVIFFNWNLKNLSMWSVMRELRDPWIKFTHDYYTLVIIVFSLMLLIIDPVLVLCYSVSCAASLIAMGFINTVGHQNSKITYRNHATQDHSSNTYLAILVGEWHNNHHANPQQWNQREKWWEIDYAAQFIKLIKK